ncbi:peptidoglycan editing factor PgeF [Rickettsia typhi]|uniref:Purine nucleoside phosphorylase n=2 Tax=Rickettsia typhi TaxID=785 RepID=Q68WN9_RICTY|nr:peptidoglycan editing factor PgeF [Rickettsia typhi]AAU03953.1 conserved hypothetical protein [Rickettsia typhi str. Wilmington]AFE54334.1 putative cytoplasmic protein [Rickettsia typhi str. TH1527]AFE55173.1 putative cytoplasmic protein [Rickettsia typhi str. B9991CWPP]
MERLIHKSVYYKIFDKTFNNSSHRYIQKNYSIYDAEIVANIESITNYFKAQDILILNQVHSNQIVNADEHIMTIPEADGSITTKKNLVLTVQSADCVPVLLASDDGKIIGAAHAGWQGSINNIISNIVTKMVETGAKNLIAVIGPAIAQSSYEVDDKYYKTFLSKDINNKQFFINSIKENHYMFDLPAFVEFKLNESGVKDIKNLTEDTYTNPFKYPSKRRSYHMQVPYNEKILSAIVIK